MQAVGLLVHAAKSVVSVPLAVRIHEGLVWSNRDKRTLLDKMLGLLDILAIKVPFYFKVLLPIVKTKMRSCWKQFRDRSRGKKGDESFRDFNFCGFAIFEISVFRNFTFAFYRD